MSGTKDQGALRQALSWLGLALVVVAALVGGNLFGLRDELFGTATPKPRPAATGFVAVPASGGARKTVLRSQPWWQHVKRLSGSAPQTATLAIDPDAIQWRARWRCSAGKLTVTVSTQPSPLIDAKCPGSGTAEATQLDTLTAHVDANAAWQVAVDQQVDVPLDEPPLAAMTAAGTTTAATGSFYRIDQSGTGRATFYRRGSGGFLLRLAPFYVTPNVDLELRLSPLAKPRTTKEFLSRPSVVVAPLPITTGSLNFRVPRGVDPTRYGSLVVWCPPTRNAYAAATLNER